MDNYTTPVTLPFKSDYQDKAKFKNPLDRIDPAQKNKEWILRRVQWGYSSYLNNLFPMTPYDNRLEWAENRAYGQGMQDVARYMDILCPIVKDKYNRPVTIQGTGQAKRKGWYNINWDVLAIAPKFRDLVIGMFMKADFNIGANAIDEKSDDAKNTLKYQAWAEQQEAEFLKLLDFIAKTKPDESAPKLPFKPSSLEELEMLSSIGCFKLGVEIAMESLLDLCFYISRWGEIKKQMFEDFYDLGLAACVDYTDPNTNEIRARYVDPVNLCIRQSRSNSFDNIDYWAEFKYVTIGNIKEMDPNIPEEKLRAAAQRYQGMYGNPTWGFFDSVNIPSPADYYNYRVLIKDGEFESEDYEVYKVRQNENGDKVVKKEPYRKDGTPYNGFDTKEKKVLRHPCRQWYRYKWVVGTDILYDYGYQYDVPRKIENEPRASLHAYRCAGRSIGSRVKNPIDAIQLNYYKLQNDIVKAPSAGIAIEVKAISNITLGEQKMKPMDILKIYRSNGDLIWAATTHHQTMLNGGHKPIEQLEGGIGRSLPEKITIFDFNLNLIREITGLSQTVDASAPQPNQAVGTTKIAAVATNNILQPLLGGYQFIKEQTAINFCLRGQLLARYKKISGYYQALGASMMQYIQIGNEITMAKYGIKLEAIVDEDEKLRVLQAAMDSLAAAKTGGIGITLSDYFFILRTLAHGNLKYAEVYLAFREQQQIAQQQAAQRENEKNNAQAQQAALDSKIAADTELQKIQSNEKVNLLSQKGKDALALENLKKINQIAIDSNNHINKIIELRAEASLMPKEKATAG